MNYGIGQVAHITPAPDLLPIGLAGSCRQAIARAIIQTETTPTLVAQVVVCPVQGGVVTQLQDDCRYHDSMSTAAAIRDLRDDCPIDQRGVDDVLDISEISIGLGNRSHGDR